MTTKEFKVLLREMTRLVNYYKEELSNEKNPDMVKYYTGKLDAFSHTQLMLQLIVAKGCLASENYDPYCDCESCGRLND